MDDLLAVSQKEPGNDNVVGSILGTEPAVAPPAEPPAPTPPPPVKKTPKVTILAALLLLFITLPVAVYYVSQSRKLAELRGRAAAPKSPTELIPCYQVEELEVYNNNRCIRKDNGESFLWFRAYCPFMDRCGPACEENPQNGESDSICFQYDPGECGVEQIDIPEFNCFLSRCDGSGRCYPTGEPTETPTPTGRLVTATPTPIHIPSNTPTPTPAPLFCGAGCDPNNDLCSPPLDCTYVGVTWVCRNPQCPNDLDCVCSGTPTSTVTPTSTSTPPPTPTRPPGATNTPTPTTQPGMCIAIKVYDGTFDITEDIRSGQRSLRWGEELTLATIKGTATAARFRIQGITQWQQHDPNLTTPTEYRLNIIIPQSVPQSGGTFEAEVLIDGQWK